MKEFLSDSFLLHSDLACELYHEHAAKMPIYDYHSHLPPADIATDKRFANLFDIWLAGDHYKWRAMRTNGEPEHLCTGDAQPYEKFLAFARTVPHCLRNPLYHWTHLELRRYFGITELLNESTAPQIWNQANELLATSPDLTTHGILHKFRVAVSCSTDDPADPLTLHEQARTTKLRTRFYPTYRPDKAFSVANPPAFNAWLEKLEAITRTKITTLDHMLAALHQRHTDFHNFGCRLSDHGLEQLPDRASSPAEAATIFNAARSGQAADPQSAAQFAGFLMIEFGKWDAQRGWTKQLHLGALRNNNSRMFSALGPDTGFDSIGDFPHARGLSWYLNTLDSTNELPRIVLYNLNPADNYLFATMCGNFQDGTIPGKIQYGSGWWFLDQKEGMTWQINALSQLGLLSRFVGMLTDSRSFLSFPRHEYFRRILCNIIADDVNNGEIPHDTHMLATLVRNICFHNARQFFGLEIPEEYSSV